VPHAPLLLLQVCRKSQSTGALEALAISSPHQLAIGHSPAGQRNGSGHQ